MVSETDAEAEQIYAEIPLLHAAGGTGGHFRQQYGCLVDDEPANGGLSA